MLDGGSGDDFLSGGEGDNALYGGEGRDTLYGGSGNEVLEGGAGNDSLNGGAGNDTLDGGTGDDRLEGGEGDDVYLFGRGDGRDVIFNNDYQSDKNIKRRDVLQFKENISQRDIFVSRYDNDIVLSIKETHDRVSISNYFSDDGLSDNGSALDKIRFADGSSWNVEQIKQMVQMSTAGNDTLYGYAINDVLDGGEGDDRLYGNDGNDTLIGGSGNDTLYGGKGGDTYLFGRGDGQDVIDNLFQNWDKNEKLEGSLDVLQFREDVRPEDVYINQRNEDLLIGIGGTDDNILVKGYFSKNGQSNYTLDLIKFSDGTNWSFEQVKQRIHLGTSFNDTLKGDTGDNVLWGYSGNDILDGGLGNDTLIGGTGDDTIYAGVGDDVIVHNKNDGHDTIIKEIEDGSITVKFGDGISISDLIFVRNDFVDEIQEDDYSLFPKNVINKNYYDATSLSLVIGDLGSLSSTNSITNHDGGYHSRIQFSHLEMDQSLRYSHYGSDQSNSALFDYKRSIPKNWKKDEFEYLPWNGIIPYNDNWYLAYKERTHYVVKRKKKFLMI